MELIIVRNFNEIKFLTEEAFNLLYKKTRQNNVNIDKDLYVKFNSGLRKILFTKYNQDNRNKAREIGKFIYKIINEALNEKKYDDLIKTI